MTATPQSIEEALRATTWTLLVGCPDWCSWAVTHPEHEHVSDGVAEVVLVPSCNVSEELLLEVRHAAAPATPTALREA